MSATAVLIPERRRVRRRFAFWRMVAIVAIVVVGNRDLPNDLEVVNDDRSESPRPWPMALLEESLASFMPSQPVLSSGLPLYAMIQ